ncbi:hypothetical protein ACH5RR_003204 [Cinchona calisaya]|uniref:RNase H type-1 domain-containing protein n=1 Tax=Cinchona calisaya TaxID=153742 RepID=A0ABD3AU53_9GENT
MAEWMEHESTKDKGTNSSMEGTRENREIVRWYPPPLGMIKINTAACVNVIKGRTGLGTVGRDECGKILAAWGFSERKRRNLEQEEAEAIRLGLINAKAEDWNCMGIQSSNKVNWINTYSYQHTILEDIHILNSLFSICSFSFLNNIVNEVSSNNAQYALVRCRDFVLKESFLLWMTEIAQKDLGYLSLTL